MFIVTIEEIKEKQTRSIIGTKRTQTCSSTVYYQELDNIDLVTVIASVNGKREERDAINRTEC